MQVHRVLDGDQVTEAVPNAVVARPRRPFQIENVWWGSVRSRNLEIGICHSPRYLFQNNLNVWGFLPGSRRQSDLWSQADDAAFVWELLFLPRPTMRIHFFFAYITYAYINTTYEDVSSSRYSKSGTNRVLTLIFLGLVITELSPLKHGTFSSYFDSDQFYQTIVDRNLYKNIKNLNPNLKFQTLYHWLWVETLLIHF